MEISKSVPMEEFLQVQELWLLETSKATPVDQAANAPHTRPKPGTNIGNATDALCSKIPIASIP